MNLSRWYSIPLLVLAIAGCSGDKSDNFVASGRAFLDKRDYPAAVIQLKNAVQNDTSSGEARYWLGVAMRRGGDPGAAEIELRKALTNGYDPDQAAPELAEALLELGQYDKVLAEAEKIQAKTPRARADLLAAQSTAKLAKGQFDDARRLAAEAVAADAASPASQAARARMLMFDRKLDEAQQVLNDAIAKNPDDYNILQLLADLNLGQGRTKEAIAFYDRAVAVRPTSMTTYLTLVPTLVRTGDQEGAEARLAALKKTGVGGPGVRYLDALLAYAKGDRKTARDAVRQVLKSGSDYLPALLLAGTVEYELGNYVVAESHLQKVATASPTDLRSRQLLVSCHLRRGDLKRAREVLAALMKLDADSVETNVLAGQVASATREPAKAAEYFRKAVALDPKNATPRTLLGASDVMRGEVQRGIQELEAASGADATRTDADVALIRYFLEQKQLDKASQAVDVLDKKQPNSPQTATLRGTVQAAKGDLAGARKAFEHALELNPTFVAAASSLAALDVRDKKPDVAANRFRTILAKDRKQVDAALMLAALLQSTGGKPAEIDQVLTDAVGADPVNVQVRLALIARLLRTDRKKEALDAAQQALAAVPDDPRLLESLGVAQTVNGEHSQAATTYGKLLAIEPRNVDVLMRQASAYTASKDFASARSVVTRAIEADPENVLLRATLVDVGLAENKPETALNDAKQIQAKWPKNSAGYIAEAMVLASQNKAQEAEAVLRSAARTVEDAGAALRLFALLLNANRAEEAEKFASEWVAARPKDATLAATAGEQSIARQDYATAVRWYRAALKARPDNPLLLNNLAWALGNLKDPQAMATAEKARALAPNNAAIIDTIGWLQLQQGNAAAAVTTLTRAATLAPGAAPIRMNLAKALIAAGHRDDAREQLLAIATLDAPKSIKEEAEKLLGSL